MSNQNYAPRGGKVYKSDGSIINEADLFEAIKNALQGTLNTQLTGSTVVIAGVTFQVSGGNTIRGTNAIKPGAALAHAAIPYCYYFAIDTGVVEATNGTNWGVI